MFFTLMGNQWGNQWGTVFLTQGKKRRAESPGANTNGRNRGGVAVFGDHGHKPGTDGLNTRVSGGAGFMQLHESEIQALVKHPHGS